MTNKCYSGQLTKFHLAVERGGVKWDSSLKHDTQVWRGQRVNGGSNYAPLSRGGREHCNWHCFAMELGKFWIRIWPWFSHWSNHFWLWADCDMCDHGWVNGGSNYAPLSRGGRKHCNRHCLELWSMELGKILSPEFESDLGFAIGATICDSEPTATCATWRG